MFAVRVAPRAGRTAITGTMGEGANMVLKIALASPPVDGRANEALIAYLAGILDVSRADVAITTGERSKNKRIRIRGRSAEQVRHALEEHLVLRLRLCCHSM
ncbi:hypothetical protein HNQ77_004358 [Silvibacterium bohemicum]|uniref:UPF0235 protein HNQ77_004358 n=1 Tax=Silvibacterium bohemicum TaxID=1577686 RepID=A0A841JYH6_9BACT|nr:DUF167 domain-containing protein [Silvibacterium bohemicum]MBB6146386.1 hypothetical protein [Silvibacterium bohemicum]